MKPLNNEEDTNNVFETGLGGRQVRKTLMNDESSRSHLIFSIIIDVTNKLNGKKTSGKLSFIDLAGSESSKKTGTDKEGQAEANAINQSLSALGNVISALAEGAKFIRYKENLLTKLMQDSLGGNTKTCMIANCGPADYNVDETISTLRYASRAKNIENKPRINEDPKDAMIREFHDEITRLREELQKYGGGIDLTGQTEHQTGPNGEIIVEKIVHVDNSEKMK